MLIMKRFVLSYSMARDLPIPGDYIPAYRLAYCLPEGGQVAAVMYWPLRVGFYEAALSISYIWYILETT